MRRPAVLAVITSATLALASACQQQTATVSALPSAAANLVQSRSNLDLAKQHFEDATVRAPMSGTIVSRPATTGSIITAATGPNGGPTLMRVADLGRVRMRVNVDEVEMGNVRVG